MRETWQEWETSPSSKEGKKKLNVGIFSRNTGNQSVDNLFKLSKQLCLPRTLSAAKSPEKARAIRMHLAGRAQRASSECLIAGPQRQPSNSPVPSASAGCVLQLSGLPGACHFLRQALSSSNQDTQYFFVKIHLNNLSYSELFSLDSVVRGQGHLTD